MIYEPIADLGRLPEGWSFVDCPGVAVDSHDNVYVLTRGEHPIIVFDRDGNFLRSFGEGLFSERSHGIYITHDGSILTADDASHLIQKFSPQGEKLLEIGLRNQPAPKWSGPPFNRHTFAATMPGTGDIYVSDGYGNSRIHVYSAQGEYKFSWGSPSIDPSQFICPHNIAIDDNCRVYIADRECHRIQIFDPEGEFIAMWNNIHRPDGIALWNGHLYIAELNSILDIGIDDAPGLGHRVSIYDLNGALVHRFGALEEGDSPGQFIAPHGIAVDSRGDIYVAEVPYTVRGWQMDPPQYFKSLKKFTRVN